MPISIVKDALNMVNQSRSRPEQDPKSAAAMNHTEIHHHLVVVWHRPENAVFSLCIDKEIFARV